MTRLIVLCLVLPVVALANGFVDRGSAAPEESIFVYSDGSIQTVLLSPPSGELTVALMEPYTTNLVQVSFGISIETLGQSLFFGHETLQTVDLLSVSTIGIQSFTYCTALKSVYAPHVTTMGVYAFLGCDKIESLEFPSLQTIKKYQHPEAGDLGGQFIECSSLKSFYAPELEVVEGPDCFYDCHALEELDLPLLKTVGDRFCRPSVYDRGLVHNSQPSVHFIGINAEKRVKRELTWPSMALKRIALPSITNIAEDAFCICTNLVEVYTPKAQFIGNWAFQLVPAKELWFPECTKLGTECFYACEYLERISLPKLEEFPERAFAGLPRLSYVDWSSAKKFGNECFRGCPRLTRVELPSTIQSVGKSCFRQCGIEYLDLGPLEVLEGIGEFRTLGSLKTVKAYNLEMSYPEGRVPSNRNDGFAYTSAPIMRFPKLKNVANNMFWGCEAEKIYLPACTNICPFAFEECANLGVLHFGNTLTSVPTIQVYPGHSTVSILNNVPRIVYVVVPDAIYPEWAEDPAWSSLRVKIVPYSSFGVTFTLR